LRLSIFAVLNYLMAETGVVRRTPGRCAVRGAVGLAVRRVVRGAVRRVIRGAVRRAFSRRPERPHCGNGSQKRGPGLGAVRPALGPPAAATIRPPGVECWARLGCALTNCRRQQRPWARAWQLESRSRPLCGICSHQSDRVSSQPRLATVRLRSLSRLVAAATACAGAWRRPRRKHSVATMLAKDYLSGRPTSHRSESREVSRPCASWLTPGKCAQASASLPDLPLTLKDAADESGLPNVLQIIGEHADQARAHGHGRIPAPVDDLVHVRVSQFP
jgi:hypothetical protein